jgi:hypothetical protein
MNGFVGDHLLTQPASDNVRQGPACAEWMQKTQPGILMHVMLSSKRVAEPI